MTKVTIICADINEWAESYNGQPFHAVLCDPPYNLSSSKHTLDGIDKSGFMCKRWDTGVSFRARTWENIARVLYPGAFVLAFGGSRTVHRQMVAQEDAGLIIHNLLAWIRGAGFRKATNCSLQIDKAFGKDTERDVVGYHEHPNHSGWVTAKKACDGYGYSITMPHTEQAKIWDGHFYGRQALKPLMEPITMCQKPYEGKPIECIMETGAGTLNIEAARVGTDKYTINTWDDGAKPFGNGAGHEYSGRQVSGRWPPNLIMSHLPECRRVGMRKIEGEGMKRGTAKVGYDSLVIYGDNSGIGKIRSDGYVDADGTEMVEDYECAEGCPIKIVNEQSGILKSGNLTGQPRAENKIYNTAGSTLGTPLYHQGDEGYASRFYPTFDYVLENMETCFFYCAQASSSEKDAGLNEFEDVVLHEHDMLNGSTEFRHDIRHKDGGYAVTKKPQKNTHPTAKPLELCVWLASLLGPPKEYAPRRLLIPFSGSGSEAISALLSGYYEEIVCIEQSEEYCKLAQARVDFWQEAMQKLGTNDVKEIIAYANSLRKRQEETQAEIERGQMELF